MLSKVSVRHDPVGIGVISKKLNDKVLVVLKCFVGDVCNMFTILAVNRLN